MVTKRPLLLIAVLGKKETKATEKNGRNGKRREKVRHLEAKFAENNRKTIL